MSTPTKAPPTPTDATSPVTLDLIDRTLIDADADFNPRSMMDRELLDELTTSVRQVGVLQPVTVVRAGERYRLVIGHRRFAAATSAELVQVPALVYESLDETSRLRLAIIENVQREDMHPMDEALAYQRAIKDGALTQKQLAGVIGKSQSHVSERLRLLKLPEGCRSRLASGELPLAAAKPLASIAGAKATNAAAIADACAQVVASTNFDVELDEFLEDPATPLYLLASDHAPEGAPFVYRVGGFSAGLRLSGHVGQEMLSKLEHRAATLNVTGFSATSEDVDAARAYGCLLEVETDYSTQRFITDASFLADRVTTLLDERQRIVDERTAAAAAEQPSASTRSTTSAVPTATDTARAKTEERARSERERVAAIHANRDLGLRLQKQLGSRKADRGTIELLVQLVLGQNHDLAARGIAYTHEDFHTFTEKRQKNGKLRTTIDPLDPHDAHTRALDWVLRPRSVEEVLGRLMQLLVGGVFADERAVARSRRTSWHISSSRTTEPMLAKIARKILPEHFHAYADRLLPASTPPTPKKRTKAAPARATKTATKATSARKARTPKAGSK